MLLLLLMSKQVLNVAGVGSFTDEGMSVLMPKSGPTLQDITLDGATSLGEERSSQACLHRVKIRESAYYATEPASLSKTPIGLGDL